MTINLSVSDMPRAGNIVILVAVVSLTGCAHFIMRGSVVAKESDVEAQVCLGNNEVKPGDRVALFKTVCRDATSSIARTGLQRFREASAPFACSKERIGGGTVIRALDEHMSIVKVDAGVQFKEGMIVEKE